MTAPADWPTADELLHGLRSALADGDPAAADWAGELLVAVDRCVGGQLAVVLAEPHVARLEAAWRALAAVVAAAADVVTVQIADLTASELPAADDWLDRAAYVGPIDTRGGRPIALIAIGHAVTDVRLLGELAERALCPLVVPADGDPDLGRFVVRAGAGEVLRPPLTADPAWSGWFEWPATPEAAGPLTGGGPQAVAAGLIRSVVAVGWPVDLARPDLSRLLIAARFGQLAAVWCRGSAGRPPADVAADIADAFRGQHVGPRLPLRWVEASVEPRPGGGVAAVLRLAPRLGGDDPDEVPVTVRVAVSTV